MPEPAIRQAIDFTQDTLIARAVAYRNLVAILSLGICSLVVLTLVTWDLKILWGLCWLFPLVNGWLWLDARRMRGWTDRVLEICHVGQLDVEVFRSTIAHLKHLPQATLGGMLDLLPPSPTASPGIKEDLSRKQPQAHLAERTLWISLIISTIGCLVIMAGLFVTPWLLLLGLAICIGCARLSHWIVRWLACTPCQ